jgi:hypothetical protein
VLWALCAIALVYVAGVVYQVAVRVRFPYDHLIWSESPFLTNMLKLHHGVAVYGAPADANSFVYSPGLEYLCYALLAPVGLHLSLTACRVVNVAVGVAAALGAGWVQTELACATSELGRRRLVLALTSALSGLVVFKNFTADVCHPDNLHMLHLSLAMALGQRALTRGDHRLALGACAALGGGVLLKQTCALGALGVAVCLAIAGRARWGTKKSLLLPAAALATTALATAWLLSSHGRFWTLEVLMAQPQYLTRLDSLWALDVPQLHRFPLWAAAPFCAVHALTSASERQRGYALLWLGAGCGVLPALFAYVKHFGLWNNLVAIDLWLAMLVVPTLIALSHEHLERAAEGGVGRAPVGSAAAALLAMVALGGYPSKRVPPADLYRYGAELEAKLREDRAAGRRVLVAHGTAALIRAGYREVPLDRSNSVLEMVVGRHDALAETDARFTQRAYDRVYLNWPTYGERIDTTLMRNYKIAGRVDAAVLDEVSMNVGYINHMSPQIVVLEPKPRAGAAEAPLNP